MYAYNRLFITRQSEIERFFTNRKRLLSTVAAVPAAVHSGNTNERPHSNMRYSSMVQRGYIVMLLFLNPPELRTGRRQIITQRTHYASHVTWAAQPDNEGFTLSSIQSSTCRRWAFSFSSRFHRRNGIRLFRATTYINCISCVDDWLDYNRIKANLESGEISTDNVENGVITIAYGWPSRVEALFCVCDSETDECAYLCHCTCAVRQR